MRVVNLKQPPVIGEELRWRIVGTDVLVRDRFWFGARTKAAMLIGEIPQDVRLEVVGS